MHEGEPFIVLGSVVLLTGGGRLTSLPWQLSQTCQSCIPRAPPVQRCQTSANISIFASVDVEKMVLKEGGKMVALKKQCGGPSVVDGVIVA